ncbi:QWRF motif-containing protein 2-like [Phragmites australis]|uniref:QWRF motif-containing protein 2-like n=1 Tax=Phragmites australis TaxID=29695 RepID=UPI002D771C8A|nr:QWRF motif-containing protein 2-like [Phragmites australis]
MPSTMVDTAAAPRLKPTGRRHLSASTTLSNATAGCVAAALSNANAGSVTTVTKPKAKTVASRYLAPSSKPTSATATSSSSRRLASPTPRRLAFAEQLRPALPNAITTGATGSAIATTRTLSVAFQSPTYSLDTSKARSVSPAEVAAITPEKRRPGIAATVARGGKMSDGGQKSQRWPASATAALCGNGGRALAKVLEHSASNNKANAAIFAAARSTAFDGTPRRASVDGANEFLQVLSSDTDSASSGGSRDGGADKLGIASGSRPSPRTTLSSSARFSRDAVGTRSDRFAYPATPFSSRTSAAALSSPATAPVKKRSLLNNLLSSPFSRSYLKQPSPSKPVASSFGRTTSPSRAQRSVELPGFAGKLQGKASSTNCGSDGDIKLKPPGVTKADDEHQLRLLYTRHLQWRHANAKAGAALSSQTIAAEKYLCGAWISILRMRKSAAIRKLQLQLLRNNCKLMAILRGQMKYLEQWSSLERDYAISLSGTTQALNATILCLPVSDGTMADIQALKNAIGSAVDVMQSIGNSTSTQLSKLARTNVLACQLSRVAIQELVLMAQCRELLSTLASLHVKYSSLQGQRIQLNQRRLRSSLQTILSSLQPKNLAAVGKNDSLLGALE